MTLTYKTDDSFFTMVLPPFVYYGFSVKNWFTKNGTAKFRYIKDTEIEKEFWKLEQVQDIYPGIKTITIAVNPWARMRYAYSQLCIMKENNDTSYLDLNILKLDSFDEFITSLTTMEPVDPFWFTFATPMSKWIEYNNEDGLVTVDYILKAENLEEDFKGIQEYFCSTNSIHVPKKLPSYKKFYNKTTKAIVAEVFKEDIQRFGYKF